MIPSSFEGTTQPTSAAADGWQTIGGIDYRYGLNKTDYSRNFSHSDSFSESRSESRNASYIRRVNFPTSIEERNVFWYRFVNKTKANPSENWTLQGGFGWNRTVGNFTGLWDAWFRYNGIINLQWNPLWTLLGSQQALVGLAGGGYHNNGTHLVNKWYTTNVTIVEEENATIPKWDWLRKEYGMVNETVKHLYYWFNNETPANPNDDFVVFEELLIPAYVYVVVTFETHKLSITTTTSYGVSLGGSYNLSASYEETIWGHNVEIKLADRYHLGYRAIENATGNYSLTSGFSLDGKVSLNATHNVQFENGTAVPEAIRPWWLRSFNSSTDGSWSFNYAENGSFFGVSALQGIIQGVLTTLSNDSFADLVIWGGWDTGRMIGYVDDNGNDRLDVALNNSVIETPDKIFALGLPEGVHIKGNATATSAVTAGFFREDTIKGSRNNQISKVTTRSGPFDRIHGFDPEDPNINLGTTTLTWDTPSYDAGTGKANFGWTVSREDWPVWWTVANGTVERLVVIDKMDLSDSYDLDIDTTAGIATLQNDHTQSTVTNSTLAAMVADLSLATYHRDLFLSVSALQKGMDGAMGQETDVNSIKIGGVSVATAVFGDTKANYTLGGTANEYISQTTVMNLLTMSGQVGNTSSIESTGWNPFISPLAQRVALGLVHVTASSLGALFSGNVHWLLSENIVVISYPTWGGASLVHDPTFTATFAAQAAEEPSASDSETASQLSLSSSEPAPESTPAAASAAGVFVIGSLLVGLGIIRRRLRK